jgi:hypothetical protein
MNRTCLQFCLVLPAFVLFSTNSAPAQDVPAATTQQQAVAYAHAAEADPLGPQADQQRKAAMAFDENDHTSHVLLCTSIFTQMNSAKGSRAHDISLQMIISAAAFLYEHPEAANDSGKQNVAGLNAALNVYEKFLAADPKAKSSFYDNLLKKRSEGKLEKEVADTCPK